MEGQPAPEPTGPLLDLLEHSSMWVPVTDFGFVRPAIARDLVATIARAAERYAAPRVVLSGGAALVDDDDRFVWVELKADDDSVAVMRGISREVVAVVEPLGFYCDRRQFRSRIPLAVSTTSPPSSTSRSSSQHSTRTSARRGRWTRC